MLLRRVYSTLIRVHPERFRSRYGQEMLWIYDESAGADRTLLFMDGILSAFRQRLLRREPAPTPASPAGPVFALVDSASLRLFSLSWGIAAAACTWVLLGVFLAAGPRLGPRFRVPAPWYNRNGLTQFLSEFTAPAVLGAAPFGAGEAPATPVVIGGTIPFPSRILKETRTLFIAKPPGYDGGAERYPVLYLLDAEEHFRFTAPMVDFLAANDRMPPMLVVGIGAGSVQQRTRDLTPPSTAAIDNRFSPGNGGAAAFLSFLETELIPYVDRTYRTRPYRLLAGHSFGGLFAIYALAVCWPETELLFDQARSLATKRCRFDGYIAVDPSLDWNNQAVVARVEARLARSGPLPIDLYMAATSLTGKVPTEIARFEVALSKSAPPGFRWKFDWMPREDHMSIPLPGMRNGLESIFEEWHLSDPLSVFDQGGIEAIHRRFREAGKRFGFPERTTPPFTVSLVVAALIGSDRLEDAATVLLHDPAHYPPPWNQLDALARAYEKCGDSAHASRYRRMSLERNPNSKPRQ
jgi:uncharacterized protein